VVSCDRGQLFQLLAIDHRYVVALSRISPKTHLRLFSRRGQCLGELCLPIEFEQAIALNKPYQFAALEADHPKSLLLIQLKPLKILRVKLAIAPKFIAAFPWGLVAVDTFGQMVILDQQGQPLGQAEIPGPVSAIASFGKTGLVIATWQQSQGKLYTFDLHQFGIESV
jgi:hypothetical protein